MSMRLRNSVQLIGNLGSDPEIKTMERGKLAKFTLATDESYKDKEGQKVSATQWHTIEAWDKTAELVEQFVKKGQLIALEGRLRTSSYENNNGEKRYFTNIVAHEVLLLSKPEGGGAPISSEEE